MAEYEWRNGKIVYKNDKPATSAKPVIRVEHEKPKPKPAVRKTKGRRSKKWLIIPLILVLITGVAIVALKFHHTKNPAKTVVDNTVSQSRSFTSPRYNFAVNFPGNPKATDSTLQASGHAVSYTTFDSTVANGTQEYDAYAYNWPAQYYNFDNASQKDLQNTLKTAADGLVKGIHGNMYSSKFDSYLNHSAIDAIFTIPIKEKSYTGYVRLFFIKNYEYGLLTIGAPSDNFYTFANSFIYTGS